MAQILIEESAIDTLRDMVQKLQDQNVELVQFARKVENTFAGAKHIGSIEHSCHVQAAKLVAKHTTAPKVMA